MSYPFVDHAGVGKVLTGAADNKVGGDEDEKKDGDRNFVRSEATTLTPELRQQPFYMFKSREQVRRARKIFRDTTKVLDVNLSRPKR